MLVGNLTISIFQHWSDEMWMCDALTRPLDQSATP